jgi:hypothetical protein
MFGISESNILEQGHHLETEQKDNEIVRLTRNQTEPNLIVDGVDIVSIFREAESVYLVEYLGYLTGCLSVTQRGVEELVDCFFQDQSEIPSWVIGQDQSDLPNWLQKKYEPPGPVQCDECGNAVSVTRIVTPLFSDGKFCPDCWSQIQ